MSFLRVRSVCGSDSCLNSGARITGVARNAPVGISGELHGLPTSPQPPSPHRSPAAQCLGAQMHASKHEGHRPESPSVVRRATASVQSMVLSPQPQILLVGFEEKPAWQRLLSALETVGVPVARSRSLDDLRSLLRDRARVVLIVCNLRTALQN